MVSEGIATMEKRIEKDGWSIKSADITAGFTNRLVYDDRLAEQMPEHSMLCRQDSSDPEFSRWELEKARRVRKKEKKLVVIVTLDTTPKVEIVEAP